MSLCAEFHSGGVFDGGHEFHHSGQIFGVGFAEDLDEGDGVGEVFIQGVGVGPESLVFEGLEDVVGCHAAPSR